MNEEVLSFPVSELLDMYRKKSLSPVEATRVVFEQLLRFNPAFNAFVHVADADALMAQARESEGRWMRGAPMGPLDGVPVSVKDWYNIAGWPTRSGSLTTSSDPQGEDSPPVARLREAGALFLGKTTLPEYGHKGATFSPVSGVTRNPWNPEKTPGGSSGGAGVAAATGMGFLHLGSDAGGSIRIPSAFCGIFGFKPTPGLVPYWPPSPFSSLSSAGPMTRHVEDAALMLDVLSGPEARDWNAVPYKKTDFALSVKRAPGRLRIAYAPTISGVEVHPDVARHVRAAAKKMETFGAVEEVTLDLPALAETFSRHWMAVAAWMVARFPPHLRAKMDPWMADWAARGDGLHLNDYISAEVERMHIGSRLKMLLEQYDLLVTPTMALPAFDAELNGPPDENGAPRRDWTPFTFLANLAKLPAASVPCGLTAEGLPVGVQVMAGYLKDELALQACHALEREIGFEDWLVLQKSATPPKGGAWKRVRASYDSKDAADAGCFAATDKKHAIGVRPDPALRRGGERG